MVTKPAESHFGQNDTLARDTLAGTQNELGDIEKQNILYSNVRLHFKRIAFFQHF